MSPGYLDHSLSLAGVCRKANCRPKSWKQWTGDIEEGSCDMQTRIRPFTLTWSLEQQTGSCSGMQTTCPPPESDYRKMCKFHSVPFFSEIDN